jgi:hypothetical protein
MHSRYRPRPGAPGYRALPGAPGYRSCPGAFERLVRFIGRPELRLRRLRLAITPIGLRVVWVLLPVGIRGGHGLIRRGTVSRLLRRWRIPRVIRHVAYTSLSLFRHALARWGSISNSNCNYLARAD